MNKFTVTPHLRQTHWLAKTVARPLSSGLHLQITICNCQRTVSNQIKAKIEIKKFLNLNLCLNLLQNGGGERDRTDDPLRARQVLSQLSYTPIFEMG